MLDNVAGAPPKARVLLVVPQHHMERNMSLAAHHAPELYICCPGTIPVGVKFKAAIIPEPVFSNANGKAWVEAQVRPNLAMPSSPIFIV